MSAESIHERGEAAASEMAKKNEGDTLRVAEQHRGAN